MTAAVLPALSREYVRVPVTAEGTDAAALRAMTVEFAFKDDKPTQPAAGDWAAGSWEAAGADAVARILVGPAGAVALDVGTHYVWIRVTGSIERPVRQVGQLRIT